MPLEVLRPAPRPLAAVAVTPPVALAARADVRAQQPQPATIPAPAAPTAPQAAAYLGAEALTRMFGSTHSGWTGGDATYSAHLPDGRNVWIFGDSFVGGIQPDGSRSHDQRTFVRNSLVVQDGTKLRTITGGSAADPVDFVLPPGSRPNKDGRGPDAWYWPGDAVAGDGELVMFMNRFTSGADPEHSWIHGGTDVVRVGTDDFSVRSITPVGGSRPGIHWGAATAESPEWLYIYGSEDRRVIKHAHVARAPRSTPTDSWEYWDGSGWNPDPRRSARLNAEVSNQFSVVQAHDGWNLVTQHGYGRDLLAYRAPEPWGPFTAPRVIAHIPEQPWGRQVYNAVTHPHLGKPGDLVVSFNVGGADFMANHESYRPGFIELPLNALDDSPAVTGVARGADPGAASRKQ